MKSLFFLLFICTLYLPVTARSLSLPPKGPGDPEPVCLVWNGKKETPPVEMVVNITTHFCAVILEKDSSGEWQLERLDIKRKFGSASTNSLCYKNRNTYNYVCVGDRCTTTGPLKENAKGSDEERRKEQECLKEIKVALDKSLPLLYPTVPSPIARSLLCLDGPPPYARQLSESHSHCVAHFALDPVRESCEVIKYSAVKEPNLNIANNTCISEDGHAICYCDSLRCNWELEKFHPALTSLGQSLRSRSLSSCKPKPQCAVMKENTEAVKFEDRKETGICFIEYSADGTVKKMGRQEPQEKTPTVVERMCQVRDKKGLICFCKSHKCVAEFVPNCGAGKGKSVHCTCKTEKCHNDELEEHLRDLNKQIDPSGKDCLTDIEQWTTDSTTAKPPPTVPRNTDALFEDEVGTTTVSIHRSTTGQGKEKATTSATGSTTQGQKTDGKSVTSPPVQKTTRASNPERDTNENSEGQSGKAEEEKRKETEKEGGFPNWAIYVIVGLVLLVLTYITAVVIKLRKEKKAEAERKERRERAWEGRRGGL